MNKPFLSGDGFAITAALIWGINYPLVKSILQAISENEFMLIRFIVSTTLLISYLLISGEGIGISKNHYSRLLILGLLGVGLYNVLWTCGIHRTTAANAALLISTSPIFTGIYAIAIGQEKVSRKMWAGTLLAFWGIYLIISNTPGTEFSFSSRVFVGNMLVLSGSLLFALYAIIAKPLLEYYSPLKLTAMAMLCGLPIILLYAIYQKQEFLLSAIGYATWLKLLFIIFFGTIAAYVFWYKGVKQTSPVKTTIYHYIVPTTSMFLGALFLEEPINSSQLLGSLFVFWGLIIAKTDVISRFKRTISC